MTIYNLKVDELQVFRLPSAYGEEADSDDDLDDLINQKRVVFLRKLSHN